MPAVCPRLLTRGGVPVVLLVLALQAAILRPAGGANDPHAQSAKELACDVRRAEWLEYREAYRSAAQALAHGWAAERRAAARIALAEKLLQRTRNISDVLSCNVGVVAGYYMLARLASPLAVESLGRAGADEGEAGLAYRLLQMALVFIFTLRNGNRIPERPGVAWGVSEQAIIPAIMQMRKGHKRRVHGRLRRLVPISPAFRDRSLRIAVVSICAYPPNHPLALPEVTPPNRDTYTRRHGYALRLHLEPPVLGAHGLGVQHAKLATVLAYLQSGEFDWVAWLDCDSIIMNMNRTLDSIIYQYTQHQPQQHEHESITDSGTPICGATQGLPDLSGEWLDSWTPLDMQESAVVKISQALDGQIVASAQQFGDASGRVGNDLSLEFNFPDGPLRGIIVSSAEEELAEGVAIRLEWDNGAVWTRRAASTPNPQVKVCMEPCLAPGPDCAAELDPEIDLIITEEGWGLSSANWLIRKSAWSMNFLHAALTAAHVEMRLFGDQDAIILHLMNQQALTAASDKGESAFNADPIDRHAAVVPQFELNAYDALNALTMDCDTFVEGDLLITFPQCKDAEGCNDVFHLAAEYADDADRPSDPHAGAWWSRRERFPRWPRYNSGSSPAIRIFGPRPLVRDIFLREQSAQRSRDGEG